MVAIGRKEALGAVLNLKGGKDDEGGLIAEVSLIVEEGSMDLSGCAIIEQEGIMQHFVKVGLDLLFSKKLERKKQRHESAWNLQYGD